MRHRASPPKEHYAAGIKTAYWRGRNAALNDPPEGYEANPYKSPSHRLAWQEGFMHQRLEALSDHV